MNNPSTQSLEKAREVFNKIDCGSCNCWNNHSEMVAVNVIATALDLQREQTIEECAMKAVTHQPAYTGYADVIRQLSRGKA